MACRALPHPCGSIHPCGSTNQPRSTNIQTYNQSHNKLTISHVHIVQWPQSHILWRKKSYPDRKNDLNANSGVVLLMNGVRPRKQQRASSAVVRSPVPSRAWSSHQIPAVACWSRAPLPVPHCALSPLPGPFPELQAVVRRSDLWACDCCFIPDVISLLLSRCCYVAAAAFQPICNSI